MKRVINASYCAVVVIDTVVVIDIVVVIDTVVESVDRAHGARTVLEGI